MSRSKKGFTLAEVLITLLIIGVIASIVIPALVGDTQQAELKVGVKKAVATLNQALTMSIAQDAKDASAITNTTLINIFANKLNYVTLSASSITTADGMQFTFFTNATGTTSCDPITSTVDIITTASCYVLVDVNGSKKPNKVSQAGLFKDQYYIIVRDKAIIPAKTSTTAGYDMAQQAMYK
ncbi:MAG: prepilin-type N-terminal cleavage/methylation domain-containing protein [Candidatus Gastranaerophilales bacterium]|nr:prepilin-type N-terminal cleavage/methylation domain-containing protein [Candidatus Gastranaerophilales bacterium]